MHGLQCTFVVPPGHSTVLVGTASVAPVSISRKSMKWHNCTAIYRLLDWVLPMRQFVRRQRPPDPWFDQKCCGAKRLTRAYSAANHHAAAARGTTCRDITIP